MSPPSYLVVLPAIDVFLTRACLRHVAAPGDNLLLVDNTASAITVELEPGGRAWDFRYHRSPDNRNLGVAASWNVGAQMVLDEGRDWLIVMSCAFIPLAGLLDLVGRLPVTPEPKATYHTVYSWHCRPIHREQLKDVGLFDPDFFPCYYEDADFDYRSRLHGWDAPHFLRVAGLDLGPGHGVQLLNVDHESFPAKFVAKWGGMPGHERYAVPYAAHSHRDGQRVHDPA